MLTAVVLVCDRAYLVPTIGTALAARANISDPSVPVLVFLTDADADLLSRVRSCTEPYDVRVHATPFKELADIRRETYAPGHVSISAMARLWLDDYLPSEIGKFLYLDGDVDITGSLDALLTIPVPAGGFLAAPDWPALINCEVGFRARWIRRYLDGLGLNSHAEYFNSGVLLVDRSGWGDVCAAARQFFFAYPERCIWHDQSALNAAAGRAKAPLSLLWNYSTEFMATVDPRRWGYEPVIWHFTGFPKPWDGNRNPWGIEFGRSLRLGSDILSPAGLRVSSASASALAEAKRVRELICWRLKWFYPIRRSLRTRRIRSLLQR